MKKSRSTIHIRKRTDKIFNERSKDMVDESFNKNSFETVKNNDKNISQEYSQSKQLITKIPNKNKQNEPYKITKSKSQMFTHIRPFKKNDLDRIHSKPQIEGKTNNVKGISFKKMLGRNKVIKHPLSSYCIPSSNSYNVNYSSTMAQTRSKFLIFII